MVQFTMIFFVLSIQFQLVVGLCICGLGVLVSAEDKKELTTAPETNETEAGETGAETENNGAIEKRGIGHGYGLGYGHGKQTKTKYDKWIDNLR